MTEIYSCTKCGAWLFAHEVYKHENQDGFFHLREREGNVIYLNARCGPVNYIGVLPKNLTGEVVEDES